MGKNSREPGEPLPAHLKPLFWEYDFSRLRWEADRDLVIAKVLARGDWEAVTWLMRRVGEDGLRAWIQERRGRGLDSHRLRFWELVLGLPRREVSRWLRESAPMPGRPGHR